MQGDPLPAWYSTLPFLNGPFRSGAYHVLGNIAFPVCFYAATTRLPRPVENRVFVSDMHTGFAPSPTISARVPLVSLTLETTTELTRGQGLEAKCFVSF